MTLERERSTLQDLGVSEMASEDGRRKFTLCANETGEEGDSQVVFMQQLFLVYTKPLLNCHL